MATHPDPQRTVSRITGGESLVEAILGLLREGEVEDVRSAWAVDLLLQVATATGAEQACRRENPDADTEWNSLVTAIADADAIRRPRIAALGDSCCRARARPGLPEGWRQ